MSSSKRQGGSLMVLIAVAAVTLGVVASPSTGAAPEGNSPGAGPDRAVGAAISGDVASKPIVSSGPKSGRQTFLLKLDPAPTTRVFETARAKGTAARPAARAQKGRIVAAQARVAASLPARTPVLYRTHSVLAGIAVTSDADNLDLLKDLPGVAAVYPVAPKSPANSSAVPLEGAPKVWAETSNLGEGTSIAVIDTGLDYTHANFGGDGTREAYETAHADGTSEPATGSFDPAKYGGGYDLVGDDYDADLDDSVPQPDPNPLDCNGHGSHVAGSAAGYGENPDGSTFTGSYQGLTDFDEMKIGPGMAPKATLYAYRVFGCEGSSNVITEAIDMASDPNGDGVPTERADVINMSLGSSFGIPDDGDAVAANAAVDLGITVAVSSGNDGDLTDVGGSPGTASKVITVANSQDADSRIDGVDVTIDGSQDSYGVTRSELYDWSAGADLTGNVVRSPASNPAACDPYANPGQVAGKVVLVEWNDTDLECSSIVRGENLSDAGAAGFIFASNSETFSAGINGSDVIPGVLMVASGADEIRAALVANKTVVVDGTSINTENQHFPDDINKIAPSSSRGIHAAGNVKPDVTAVGTSVFSTAVGTGNDGISFTGTSMASPMVAGLAALVHTAHPLWSPLQVKADIMNTAGQDLHVNGSALPSGDTFAPMRVGAGRIEAEPALENQVLAYNEEAGAVSVSFGAVEVTGPMTLSKEVTVQNTSTTAAATYNASYDAITSVPGVSYEVSPSQVTVAAGASETVTVTFKVSDPGLMTKTVDPTIGRFSSLEIGDSGEYLPRETLAEAAGRLLLEPTVTGVPTLRVPVYSAPRPASEMGQSASLEMFDQAGLSAPLTLTGSDLGSGGSNGTGNGDPDDDIVSIAAGFELQATSGPATQCATPGQALCAQVPSDRGADLKNVGYTSDYPIYKDADNGLAYFAITTHGPRAIPSDTTSIQLDIDLDGDGATDLYLFNSRLVEEDVFVSVLYDENLAPEEPGGEKGGVVDWQPINGLFGDWDTALYDSDAIILPVSLQTMAAYGITPSNPRISYGIETYSSSSSGPVDLIGIDPDTGDLKQPLTADLYHPGLSVVDAGGDGPLVLDFDGAKLTAKGDREAYLADRGKGLMMLHLHNRNGDKDQIVALPGSTKRASSTAVAVTPESISAAVKAAGPGAFSPGGRVEFSVDGASVGTASLAAGTATLNFKVPAGATRHVVAKYLGDSNFDPSSGSVDRADPGITAEASSKRRKNGRGWYRTPVKVSFSCVTHGADLTAACPGPVTLSRNGKNQKVSRTVDAVDGGSATAKVGGIKIDRTKPKVKLKGVRKGKVYRRLPKARCVARDGLSGVKSCKLKKRRKGKRVTYIAKATDKAGNVRKKKVKVRVASHGGRHR